MKRINTFQIVATGAFILFAVVGVFVFAGIGGFNSKENTIGEVRVWGTYPQATMNALLNQLSLEDQRFGEIVYTEKAPDTFDKELVEALAAGRGPDVFFLRQDSIMRNRDKVRLIQYETLSARSFRDTFVEEGELFLVGDGIIAMPFALDPMVMYWNRDHYARAGVARPPRYWDEFLPLAESGKLTIRNENGQITQSALAIGEYRNIKNAKEFLSMLIMQAGSPITSVSEEGKVVARLTTVSDENSPAENALRFYTDFANPVKSIYTWNRGLPEAERAFVSGDLATYIGFASELSRIRAQNANLNFDVSLVPQVRNSKSSVTFGNLYGLAMSRATQNPNGALAAIFLLTSNGALKFLSDETALAPVSRELLLDKPNDPFKAILVDATLQSRAWLDPDNGKTETIFKEMIESVASGALRISGAVITAQRELENLLK